jgi:hypothetical protein
MASIDTGRITHALQSASTARSAAGEQHPDECAECGVSASSRLLLQLVIDALEARDAYLPLQFPV